MSARLVHTITEADVGRSYARQACPCCGARRSINFGDVLGRVLPGDVGKRIYNVGGGVLQVENDAQRDARLRR